MLPPSDLPPHGLYVPAFLLLRNDQLAAAHSPSKAKPGWNTASTTTASIIMGPSRAMNRPWLLAISLVKPFSSSATRNEERIMMATVAMARPGGLRG